MTRWRPAGLRTAHQADSNAPSRPERSRQRAAAAKFAQVCRVTSPGRHADDKCPLIAAVGRLQNDQADVHVEGRVPKLKAMLKRVEHLCIR